MLFLVNWFSTLTTRTGHVRLHKIHVNRLGFWDARFERLSCKPYDPLLLSFDLRVFFRNPAFWQANSILTFYKDL